MDILSIASGARMLQLYSMRIPRFKCDALCIGGVWASGVVERE